MSLYPEGEYQTVYYKSWENVYKRYQLKPTDKPPYWADATEWYSEPGWYVDCEVVDADGTNVRIRSMRIDRFVSALEWGNAQSPAA